MKNLGKIRSLGHHHDVRLIGGEMDMEVGDFSLI